MDAKEAFEQVIMAWKDSMPDIDRMLAELGELGFQVTPCLWIREMTLAEMERAMIAWRDATDGR